MFEDLLSRLTVDLGDPYKILIAIIAGIGLAARWILAQQRRATTLDSIATSVKIAADEVQVNSGKSLKDKVLLIANNVDRMAKALEDGAARMERIESRQVGNWQALQSLSQTLFLLGDHSEVAIFWTNAQGRNIEVNRYYCERLGLQREDLLDESWKAAVYPADRVAYLEAFERARSAGLRFRHPVRFWDSSRGELIHAIAWAQPVWIESTPGYEPAPGAPIRYSGSIILQLDRYIGGWTEIDAADWSHERARVGLSAVEA